MSNPHPNPAYQFKPGQSGNPAGKPRGTQHITTKLWEALQQKVNGTNETYADKLVQRILNDAIAKGNTTLITVILNRIDGALLQGIDITSNGESIAPGSDVMAIAQRVAEELKQRKTE